MKIAYLISQNSEGVSTEISNFHEQKIQLMKETSQKLHLDCEIEKVTLDVSDFQHFFQQNKDQYSAIRLTPDFQEIVTTLFPNLPTVERIIQVADCLFLEKNKWWPRSLLVDCLADSMVLKQPQIDTQSQGLVVGDNSEAQVALYVLIKMGFSKINLISDHSNKIQSILDRIKQSLFGIELKLISPDELTLLPNICSVAINTVTVDLEDPLMNDLMYLNFLKPTGLLVDLSQTNSENPLIVEAQKVEFRTLHTSEVELEIQKVFFQKVISEI